MNTVHDDTVYAQKEIGLFTMGAELIELPIWCGCGFYVVLLEATVP